VSEPAFPPIVSFAFVPLSVSLPEVPLIVAVDAPETGSVKSAGCVGALGVLGAVEKMKFDADTELTPGRCNVSPLPKFRST
jgi:hypothetical protein